MTIDEAIKHCNEVANGALCKSTVNHKACGEEHKQLAEWLKELKRMRAKFLTRKNVEGLEMDEEPECPHCGQSLNKWDEASYCHSCGQALSWDYPNEEEDEE